MARWFDEFHYFSKAEKRGIVLLLAAILIVVMMLFFMPTSTASAPSDPDIEQKQQEEYAAFMASVRETDSLKYQPRSYATHRTYESRTYYTEQRNYQRTPYTQRSDSAKQEAPQLYMPDTIRRYPEKLDEIVVFDLNRVDSVSLMRIPGIGSGIAGMILNYRRQLGGFYDISQLAEIHLDYEQLLPWFEVHEEDITPIPVNRSSVDRLRHHPYLNFYQARALVEYRQRHGDIKNLRTFILYDEFTEEDLERLSHYLSFE